MIEIRKLTEGDVGEWVRCVASHGKIENGRIKSWDKKSIFVVYKCEGNWSRFQDYTGVATNPKNLKFLRV